MAPFYDAFTSHHDYELWLGNLLPELERLALRKDKLLDVACGTGKSFLPMLERGWRVTAVDVSPAMIEHAEEKVGDEVNFSVQDMRSLHTLGSFDLVWCLDDAVNYLLNTGELEAACGGFRRNLAEGGLCLFDTNTLASYRGFFASTEEVVDGKHRLLWRGQTSRRLQAGGLAEAILDIRGPDGQLVAQVTHRQRHFPPDLVLACLRRAGLQPMAVFGHGPDARLQQPLDEDDHTKAIFIARRQERR